MATFILIAMWALVMWALHRRTHPIDPHTRALRSIRGRR